MSTRIPLFPPFRLCLDILRRGKDHLIQRRVGRLFRGFPSPSATAMTSSACMHSIGVRIRRSGEHVTHYSDVSDIRARPTRMETSCTVFVFPLFSRANCLGYKIPGVSSSIYGGSLETVYSWLATSHPLVLPVAVLPARRPTAEYASGTRCLLVCVVYRSIAELLICLSYLFFIFICLRTLLISLLCPPIKAVATTWPSHLDSGR